MFQILVLEKYLDYIVTPNQYDDMKKILFIHDFLSTPHDPFSTVLFDKLQHVQILLPELPINPYQALTEIKHLCDDEQPDLVVGWNSGCVLAQQLGDMTRVLINPVYKLSPTLFRLFYNGNPDCIGYGNRINSLVISLTLIDAWGEMEEEQFCKTDRLDENCHGLFWFGHNTGNAELHHSHYASLAYLPGHDYVDKTSVRTIVGLIYDLLDVTTDMD